MMFLAGKDKNWPEREKVGSRFFSLYSFSCFINWIMWLSYSAEYQFWKLCSMCQNLFMVGSLVAQTVKCLPTMRETQVRSLGGEDPLKMEMATHSSTLAWKIPWEEPGRLQSMGSQRIGHDWATWLYFRWAHRVYFWKQTIHGIFRLLKQAYR